MKVLELLEEIEEIVDTASGFPLTGKIMIDSNELLELVREIRVELPEEIQQAQWIKNERERILNEAKQEYERVIKEAQLQANSMVESSDITRRAQMRAEEIQASTEESAKQLKLGTYEYVDGILTSFQNKVDQMRELYFSDMFNALEQTFDEIERTFAANHDEISEMSYRTQMDADGVQSSDIIKKNEEFEQSTEASDDE